MKFLDLNGLTYFFGKVKTWAGNNYLSLKGGTINGDVNISRNVSALQFKKTNGTSTQVLIADGSVKGINSANGVAGLDSNGYVPLAQLGNLDTTVAEVVTALPTTNIKKHIYLIKDTGGVTQNQYEEYIYTGDTSATYDASKWEKLGDFRATVDLADYAKKSEAINILAFENRGSELFLSATNAAGGSVSEFVPVASSSTNGVMSNTDKVKLDGIDTTYAKKIETVDLSNIRVDEQVIAITPQGQMLNQVILFSNFHSDNDNTTIEIAFKDAASNMSGFMSIKDKNKLDTIALGATADSAITTAEIDALFA